MSAEDTQAFFARLEADPALQEKARVIQAGPEDQRVTGLMTLAAELGLHVSAADLQAAGAEIADQHLADESLGGVVGGAGCISPGLGVRNPGDGPLQPLG